MTAAADSHKHRALLRNVVVAIFGSVVFLLLVWAYLDTYYSLVNTSRDKGLKQLMRDYQSLDRHQEQLARQVFSGEIEQPEVLGLMAEASRTADEQRLAELRDQLYQLLVPLYDRMREQGFRQLHFHLPGAVSFLRFHRPEKFGDNLWAVRAGIARVNTTREVVSGFEEGRVFNGFRYIFPLFHTGEFVGSVEASYSFRSFLFSRAEMAGGAFRLLVSRDLVVEKVWDDERQSNYMDSAMHPGFVIDRQADLSQLADRLPMAVEWNQDRLAAIGQAVAPRVKERMEAAEAFSIVTRHPEPVEVSFLPIETTLGIKGGYLLHYAPAPRIARAWSWLWIKIALSAVLVLLTVGSTSYINWRESERAKERERWLNILNEAQRIAAVGNWTYDVDSGRLTWSDEIYRIFGYPPGAFVPTYKRFMEMTHAEDRPRIEGMVREMLQHGGTHETEHRILRSDDQTRYVHERGTVERDAKGRPRLLGTMQEITDRVQAAEQSRQAEVILHSAHEGVLVANQDCRVVFSNPAAERLLGLEKAQLPGRQIAELVLDREQTTPFDEVREELWTRGSWKGELWLHRADGETNCFPALASLVLITSDLGERRFVIMLSDITDAKARESAMWHQAHHDALTGLANRTLFAERLEQAVASAECHGEQVGLLYIDLDDFKPINDAHGHAVGDALLIEISRRMEAVTRIEDTVGRLGGDELAVLVVRPETEQALEQIASEIAEVIERPVMIGGITVRPRASIGMALYPTSGATTAVLIRVADEDMYRRKQARKDQIANSRITK